MRIRPRHRRFITLIDELYEARVRLVFESDVPPSSLFEEGDCPAGDTADDDDVSVLFKGVASGTMKWLDVRQSGGKVLGELASVRELR